MVSSESNIRKLKNNFKSELAHNEIEKKQNLRFIHDLRPTGINRKLPYAMEAGTYFVIYQLDY